nr:hypothetical protein L203_05710 [Cryptococcus depauperatus CBS 7841]
MATKGIETQARMASYGYGQNGLHTPPATATDGFSGPCSDSKGKDLLLQASCIDNDSTMRTTEKRSANVSDASSLTMWIDPKPNHFLNLVCDVPVHNVVSNLDVALNSLTELENSPLAGGIVNAPIINTQSVNDPQFPYANLLAPSPVQSPFAGPFTFQPYLLANNNPGLPQQPPLSPFISSPQPQPRLQKVPTGRQQHRVHPYQSSQDTIHRHTTTRAHWDSGSSPDQVVSAESSANTPTRPSNVAPGPSTTNFKMISSPRAASRPSGRSGQKRRQKYTRTRTGCLCCRSRRIKCDEARPICKRCIIAKKDCVYPGCTSSDSATANAGIAAVDDNTNIKERLSGEESEDNERGKKALSVTTHSEYVGTGQKAFNFDLESTNTYDESALNMVSASDRIIGNAIGRGGGLMEMGLNMGLVQQQQPETPLAGVHLLDIGKQGWSIEQGGAPILSTPIFLLPWFPTAEERSLILHYCANAASLMMAIPSGLNPMLAINLPLALDSPRGTNPSADALQVALLGIGAIHQAFLLARSGVSTPQTAAMFQYASTLRETGKKMVRRAASSGTTEAALGAAIALATVDIFFGGVNWQDNFNLAKDMIHTRGGPAEMLKNSMPTQLTREVTVSPAKLMLEILTIYETFGCLPTGKEPTLIGEHAEDWWLENSRSTYEQRSVENQFGISRAMVLLLNRVTRLINRVTNKDLIASTFDLYLHTSSAITASTSSPLDEELTQEAQRLDKDVDAWIESLQLSTLEHERVQVGNRAYAHAMKILLLRRVFKFSRDDFRVQNAAQQVLQHCSWSTAALGMSIEQVILYFPLLKLTLLSSSLTWPVIIAGSCANGSFRQWVLTLLEGFKSQCCFDIDTATKIITDVWRRVDTGDAQADWKETCDGLDLHVL